MKLRKIIPVIGILIFIFLLYKIGIKNILSSLISGNLFYLFIAALFVPITIFLQAFKWDVILRKQKINIPFSTVLKLQLISIFYGFLTPGRIGSFVRIFYVKEHAKKRLSESMSNVILDKALDFFMVFLFAIFGSMLLGNYLLNNLTYVIGIIFIAFILCILFFLKKERSAFVLRFVHKLLIPNKFKKDAKESFYLFYKDMLNAKDLVFPFVFALLTWFFIYTQMYVFAKAYSIDIGYFYVIAVFSISVVVGLIPITISGLGTRELTLVALFSIFAVNADVVMAMSIVGMFVTNVIPSLAGWYFTLKKPHQL
ncbi:MAG: lysylphosphatidylglycerol synthase transmembrane domain-containing protein [Nanoarchaeota archaeon]